MTTTPTTRAAATEAALRELRDMAAAEAAIAADPSYHNHWAGAVTRADAALALPPDAPASGDFAGHTPGPWGLSGTTVETDHRDGKPTQTIAYCADYSEGTLADDGAYSANARLIAAAPALLAERDALMEAVEGLTNARDNACAERDALRIALDEACASVESMAKLRREAEQQVAELREALAECEGVLSDLPGVSVSGRIRSAYTAARAALAKVQP